MAQNRIENTITSWFYFSLFLCVPIFLHQCEKKLPLFAHHKISRFFLFIPSFRFECCVQTLSDFKLANLKLAPVFILKFELKKTTFESFPSMLKKAFANEIDLLFFLKKAFTFSFGQLVLSSHRTTGLLVLWLISVWKFKCLIEGSFIFIKPIKWFTKWNG